MTPTLKAHSSGPSLAKCRAAQRAATSFVCFTRHRDARDMARILRQQSTCAQIQSLNGLLDQVRKETADRSSAMSENIDGDGPRLLVRPLLLFASVALVIGFVAVRTDVEPYKTQFFRLFFINTLHMKKLG